MDKTIQKMVDPKIENLKSRLVSSYEQKLSDLLSICDSPIEKLMLLHFIDYFNSHILRDTAGSRAFKDLHFIMDTVDVVQPDDLLEQYRLLEKTKRLVYNYIAPYYEKVVGIRANYDISEDVHFDEYGRFDLENVVYRTFELYPQWEVTIDNVTYRIDIALFLKRVKNEKTIETKKIAIECDGYEFHSTKEQKVRDDLRTRNLMSKGWRVLRYSGTELHQIGSNRKFNEVFSQILEVFYA